MKTKEQTEAKELMNKLLFVNVVRVVGSDNCYRCQINKEIYITVPGLYPLDLQRLKKYAKKNGWKASDLFPAFIIGRDYNCVGFLVKANLMLADFTKIINMTLSESNKYRADKIKTILMNAVLPFNDSNEKVVSEKDFENNNAIWEKRQKLLKTEYKPSIEECIKILKENGYKVLKPITQYEEL